jgi:hypothetical protein
VNNPLVDGPALPVNNFVKRVLRITLPEITEMTVLSPRIMSLWIHWVGRSMRCVEDGPCKYCEKGIGRKWKGYIDVLIMGKTCYPAWIEMTPTAANLILQGLDKEKGLRGARLQMSKTRGGAKGRYIIHVHEHYTAAERLPEEQSPIKTLETLWEINARKMALKLDAPKEPTSRPSSV